MLQMLQCARSVALCILLAGGAGRQAFAQRQPIVTTDLLNIRTVTAIDVAADASKAVYAVRSIAERHQEGDDAAGDGPERLAPSPRYAYRSHLFLIDLVDEHANPRQLTFDEKQDRNPGLSPDGRRIAFLRGDESGSQVWVMPTNGGEARRLTEFDDGVSLRGWSPDGKQLLVAAEVPIDEIAGTPPWPDERPARTRGDDTTPAGEGPKPDGSRAAIRAWLADNARTFEPTVITRLSFQEEQSLVGKVTVTHLFLVGADGKADDAPRRISEGFFDYRQSVFMPDGRSILYVARKRTDVHPDRETGSDLWRLDVATGRDEPLLSLSGWSFSQPTPSVDGASIAFVGRQEDEPTFRQRRLGLITDAAPATITWLTSPESFDRPVWNVEWQPAHGSLLFTAPNDGGVPLFTINQGLLEPSVVVGQADGRPFGVEVFATGGGAVVYGRTAPSNPAVLMLRDGRGERQLHDLNAWVADRLLSMPQPRRVSRPDGLTVPYWVMEPTNRQLQRTYPVVLEMHGGPHVMWGPGEASMWHEFQLLCSWGYGVVYANPRGSSGYGYAYQHGNYQDWGEGPAGDVLAALDNALDRDDWMDPQRLVVTGGSYAGYLTAWIVGHDHRFNAAVAQRGVYDLATFFGEGNAWRLVEWSMGGPPYDTRARTIIDRNSPFSYVHRIRTPLLIMHASNDLRTGVSQSEMLYRALKNLNRPVEYIRYPGVGHDLSRTGDPHLRMDRLNRIIEFFERSIENPRPAPTQRLR